MDADFLATWLGKVLLLRVQAGAVVPNPPPGLTDADVKFLTLQKPDTWNPNAKGLNLAEVRIKIVAFLASGAFTDEERFLPALYAASSTDFRVSETGDAMLKRSSVSLEDEDLVRQLFNAHARLPSPYRIRILGLLSKSEISTGFTREILAAFRRNATSDASAAGDAASSASPGLELAKLHRALFEYINWVARIGPTKSKTNFDDIRTPVVDLLKHFIEEQGWPRPLRKSLDDIALRARAYDTIGVLAKGTAMSDIQCLSLAQWLFRSLSEDPTADVVVNIDGALSSLTSVFKPPHAPNIETALRAILSSYMSLALEGDVVRSARHAVVKWANNCLPFSDAQARWIDIMAIAGRQDERSDVVEEGQKGLDPWTYYANDSMSRALPDWTQMVKTFFREPNKFASKSASRGVDGMDVDEESAYLNFPGDSFAAFPVALRYCKHILFLTALKNFTVDPGWERQLEKLVNSDLETRHALREYLAAAPTISVRDLLGAAFEGMTKRDAKTAEECATTFVDVASVAPKGVLQSFCYRSAELMPLVTSNKRELRTLGAKAFGMLAAHPANEQGAMEKNIADLRSVASKFNEAVGSELNAAEGAFLALAHLCSRAVYYHSAPGDSFSGLLSGVFPRLYSLAARPLPTQETIFEALTQLWTAGIQAFASDVDVKDHLITPLLAQAKKGNGKAIAALGRLTLAFRTSEDPGNPQVEEATKADGVVDLVLESLYGLYEIKQAEVHFGVGEAITAAVACWDARVVQLTLDVESQTWPGQLTKRPTRVKAMLEKLLTDCKTTKPSLLKASGIWLFCVIEHCSYLPEIQSRLRECQAAFMRLLSARDELVQETASRGLSLVYEKGDPELRSELVRDLVAFFTGSGPKLVVGDDTTLFEAGTLQAGEGKSITSYKDIVSLAEEVGDQSLTYKLMSLATDASTWSTRSTFGRFGLSNLLSESEIDPKLLIKLYRYRFDPNTNVQRSMNNIWKALVKDNNAVMEEHFEAIMKDLLKSILGKEWRVREASCAAISDLIAGRPFPKYEPYYKDIWAAAVRVLDDIKATVRKAALHLCIALSTTLTRQLEESGTGSAATAMMNEALPFLLSDKGMQSNVEDVQLISLITVMKIAQKGGKALKPYIATMVPHLLELISTVEPQAVNYYYQQANESNKEEIDKMRSSMVSKSPITEAIEDCLRNVDKDVMDKLAPALEEVTKTALGMPTKIGCSRVLGTLATRHTNDFRPHAARFLQLMEKQALERNDEISQSYARAAAYILRIAPDDAKQRFVDRFIHLYLGSENEARRQKVADVVLALSKISPDHFAALETNLLPLAYLGKHDADEYTHKAFDDVWDKHAGSSRTVARYIPEITGLVQQSLNTAQWALKHAGALAIASAVASVTSASEITGQVNLEALKVLWPVYEKALALKTFSGKEKLLEPFPEFVAKAKAWWSADRPLAELLNKIALREAKRNNDEYRPHAFRCLWRVAAAREDLSMLPDIAKIVGPYLDMSAKEEDGDAMDVDKPSKTNGDKMRGVDPKSRVAWAAMEAVAKGYNRVRIGETPLAELREIVVVLEEPAGSKTLNLESPHIARSEFDIIRWTHWYGCVAELMEAAAGGKGDLTGEGLEVLKWYLATLDLERADAGTESQRSARAKAAGAVLKVWKKEGRGAWGGEGTEATRGVVKTAMEKALKEERSMDVQAKWREALALLG